MKIDVELPKLFSAALVINLPERTDRLREIKQEFAEVGWNNIRVIPGVKFAEPGRFRYAAERGCFAAHFSCLKMARDENLDSVLVLEDDILLSRAIPNLMRSVADAVATLPWDYLYFGHDQTGDIQEARNADRVVNFNKYGGEIIGNHFYAVRSRIIPRLLSHFARCESGQPGDHDFGPMPADGAHNTFRRHNPDVQTFISNPKLGWQGASRSDITPRAYDRIEILRPIISMARRAKRHMLPR